MSNELWEKIHQNMDWGLEPDPLLDLFVSTHCSNTVGKKALDIGCGRGANTIPLAKGGFEVTATDVSPTALKKMIKLVTFDLKVIPVLVDITKAEFEPNSFDLIVDVVSLSQLPEDDIASVIRKARNWLKPGGAMFSKLATKPFSSQLVRAPFYLIDEDFVMKTFEGFAYTASYIRAHVGQLEASYWLVHAKKNEQ